jgi:hypothetical protein
MNNPTLCPGCKTMIGRADIEESKSNVAMNAWLPQASYPCGNFSDTSCLTSRARVPRKGRDDIAILKTKGSIGHAFTVCIHTENPNQNSFCPFARHEISVLIELLLGHLCYRLTDVPPQPNSPPEPVPLVDRPPPLSPPQGGGGLVNVPTVNELTVGEASLKTRILGKRP